MCKWQVRVKNGHFFGERKLWGSKFFAYANISWRYFILHIFEKIGDNPSGKFAPILTDTPVKVGKFTVIQSLTKRFITVEKNDI